MKAKIQVIVGSTRPNRQSRKVAEWFLTQAGGSEELEFELLDLANWDLPFFNEPRSPMSKQIEHEHTKKWAAKIAEGDGYIWVSPEYNYSMPAVLKNAIDYLYYEWNHKPVAFISYGTMGGTRAIEQLKLVATELLMAPVNTAVHIQGMRDGNVPDEYKERAKAMVNELTWWVTALKNARQPQVAKVQ